MPDPHATVVVEALQRLPLQRQRAEPLVQIRDKAGRFLPQCLDVLCGLAQALVKVVHPPVLLACRHAPH